MNSPRSYTTENFIRQFIFLTTTLSVIDSWVKPLEFDTGIVSGELPINSSLLVITL